MYMYIYIYNEFVIRTTIDLSDISASFCNFAKLQFVGILEFSTNRPT